MAVRDRIESRLPLGDGGSGHYDGVRVSSERVEGRYFVSEDQQRLHSRKRFSSICFSSRRRHTRLQGDWSSDVCSSDLEVFRARAASSESSSLIRGSSRSESGRATPPAERESWMSQNPYPQPGGRESPRHVGQDRKSVV